MGARRNTVVQVEADEAWLGGALQAEERHVLVDLPGVAARERRNVQRAVLVHSDNSRLF